VSHGFAAVYDAMWAYLGEGQRLTKARLHGGGAGVPVSHKVKPAAAAAAPAPGTTGAAKKRLQ
jgi:hypothetical protein